MSEWREQKNFRGGESTMDDAKVNHVWLDNWFIITSTNNVNILSWSSIRQKWNVPLIEPVHLDKCR